MEDMNFRFAECNITSETHLPNMYDLYVLASTTNESYINLAKQHEAREENFTNEFYLSIPYNHMTKRFQPKYSAIYYITNFGNSYLIDKINNKEDIVELQNYIKRRVTL